MDDVADLVATVQAGTRIDYRLVGADGATVAYGHVTVSPKARITVVHDDKRITSSARTVAAARRAVLAHA
jgi:hypothetical protein